MAGFYHGLAGTGRSFLREQAKLDVELGSHMSLSRSRRGGVFGACPVRKMTTGSPFCALFARPHHRFERNGQQERSRAAKKTLKVCKTFRVCV
jgi:hypothetical protein